MKQSEEKYKKALEAAAVRNRRYRERKREMKEQYELAKRFYEDNLNVELLWQEEVLWWYSTGLRFKQNIQNKQQQNRNTCTRTYAYMQEWTLVSTFAPLKCVQVRP